MKIQYLRDFILNKKQLSIDIVTLNNIYMLIIILYFSVCIIRVIRINLLPNCVRCRK